ncbi:hypothetical protein [Coleofasciculus chthonoplastes]|uniref:hypothetical protein n=1 Tax=Coleofasciculus chthonoplastes TaxID=64178 RepID=UPI0012FBE62D|nr:hypothetical protein [Coleofasciculus chthonoplastes]
MLVERAIASLSQTPELLWLLAPVRVLVERAIASLSQTLEPLWLLVPQRVLVNSRSRC